MWDMKEIRCGCNTCHVNVEPINHFTSVDGRILCDEHSKGVEPCSIKLKEIIMHEKTKNLFGKIEYLYNSKSGTKIGEIIYFKDKKSFEEELNECYDVGIPINPVKYNQNEAENEREK